jgi:hypothetical protein
VASRQKATDVRFGIFSTERQEKRFAWKGQPNSQRTQAEPVQLEERVQDWRRSKHSKHWREEIGRGRKTRRRRSRAELALEGGKAIFGWTWKEFGGRKWEKMMDKSVCKPWGRERISRWLDQ